MLLLTCSWQSCTGDAAPRVVNMHGGKGGVHVRGGSNVFYVLLDCVIGNMTNRYMNQYMHWSPYLVSYWKYLNMNEREVEENAKIFVAQHAGDVSFELVQEIMI